jgi:hypothetical protein
MSLVIGASGRARHGKTIFCEAIYHYVTQNGGTAKIYDVGDMIRREAINQGRIPNVERNDMTRAQLEILIAVGKEMRKIEPNYWINRLLHAAANDVFDVALCPNLRLPIEAQAFRDVGGYVVRCTRLNKDGSLFISEDRPPNDITETALQFWPADFYLTTVDGDVDFMALQAVTLYKYLTSFSVRK